jgi:addiction module HigA family antidote
LEGDRAGQHAIWINDQWRICFRWHDGNAYDVEIADYHDESFFWGKRARAQMTGSELIETYPPVHPGEILQDEFMEPHGLSAYSLAAELGVDHMRIYRITRGEQTVTTDTALRLSRFFGTTARFWLNLQDHYDLEVAARDEGVQRSLEKIRRIRMEDPAPQHGEVR